MTVRERTYEEIALGDPERQWELHRGVLREKPAMAFEHNRVMRYLDRHLQRQLDPAEFEVSVNASRVRRAEETYYIPDLLVLPVTLTETYHDRRRALEVYVDALPLVVEIWSPSTGTYDIDDKLPEYQRRGDHDIWRIHPFERTLTAWRRQPDGSYAETLYRGGVVRVEALPNVTIDLDQLFDA